MWGKGKGYLQVENICLWWSFQLDTHLLVLKLHSFHIHLSYLMMTYLSNFIKRRWQPCQCSAHLLYILLTVPVPSSLSCLEPLLPTVEPVAGLFSGSWRASPLLLELAMPDYFHPCGVAYSQQPANNTESLTPFS